MELTPHTLLINYINIKAYIHLIFMFKIKDEYNGKDF